MPTNSLNDAKCRAAKPGEKAYKLFDGGGLHLYVSPQGAKTWRLAYRLAGTPKTISFGPYPEVSLSQARTKRDEVKAKLRDGDDPMAPRKAIRKGLTLGEASATYWAGRKDITAAYRMNALNGIAMHLKAIGDRNIGSITRDDLLNELRKMDDAGLHTYVRTVRMWIGQVFEWAVEHGDAAINPAALIRPEKAFGKKRVEHFAAVEVKEVPELMRRIRFEGDLLSVLACRLMAYTWVRTKELRLIELSEIDEAEGLWLIPGAKMKNGLDHLVPLPVQTLAIIQQLKNLSRGDKYLLPNSHRRNQPMSENAVLYLLHRIGYKHRMTGHGFRSVASTWANTNGFNPDAIERQLSHVPKDKVRAAYNRAEYLPERRKMIHAWADWLESCEIDPSSAQG
jgi:integrase